ncbi:beta-lactamase family [Fusarium albosuccineum]|uniref:Beta-lactamase family n=1 Tax=Fusarium albosuccineum TaxID=1237068 RepID=A0A8H4PJH3_9HYPO|nr:beta-lactamase family [Fusarium albosuccineum]
MENLPEPDIQAQTTLWQDVFCLAETIIRQTCQDSGTPGLAIGVFNRDAKLFDNYLGFRDVEKELPPDGCTVFNIGSMCKGFTALAIACLVTDGKLHWDDRVEHFLGNLRGAEVGNFTIRDFLSHRTGLCRSDALFVGSDNRLLLLKAQGTAVLTSLNAGCPPRQNFIYNNFGYHAVGCVIEKVSSMSYGDFLAQRIFKPLNMDRTFTDLPPILDMNIARAYVPYHNLKPREVPTPRISSNTVAFAAGGIRSCLRDLLVFHGALLRVITTNTADPRLRIDPCDIHAIFDAVMPLHVPQSFREQSYSMGWARTQLPNQMSAISGNSGVLDAYPTIGDWGKAPLVLHHGGNNLGCSSTMCMMPELDVGIVVLGNSLGHCDATDWTAQILTEAYLWGTIKSPFRQYVNASAARGRTAMDRVQAMLDKEKKPSGPPGDLERYTGCFWHKSRQFCIVVELCERRELAMLLQGREDEKHSLRHYHHDTFVFNETFDQVVDRGQWCRPHWFYKIEFVIQDGVADALRWRIDDTQEQGQIFQRDNRC